MPTITGWYDTIFAKSLEGEYLALITWGDKPASNEAEADRIARERKLATAAHEKLRQSDEARRERIQIEDYIRQIREEISHVLRLLAEQGYPSMQSLDVTLRVPRLGGLLGSYYRRTTKAAWDLGETYECSRDGATYTGKIYLLSGGYIGSFPDFRESSLGAMWLPRELEHVYPFQRDPVSWYSRILSSLQHMREQLEANSGNR